MATHTRTLPIRWIGGSLLLAAIGLGLGLYVFTISGSGNQGMEPPTAD